MNLKKIFSQFSLTNLYNKCGLCCNLNQEDNININKIEIKQKNKKKIRKHSNPIVIPNSYRPYSYGLPIDKILYYDDKTKNIYTI